jgi:hypothetical protein
VKNHLSVFLLLTLAFASQAWAETPIEVVLNRGAPMSESAVIDQVKSHLDISQYQSIKAQVVSNKPGVVDSILIYLRSQNKVTSTSVRIDKLRIFRESVQESIPENYAKEKTLAESTTVFCPDESVQFISFSHRKLPWDQKAVKHIADVAEKSGYNVVRLLKERATRQNYLNYLSCPNLVGDFYDGDANPDQLETYDVPITSQDISTVLNGAFRNHVTHVWIACKAFNDPMLSAMVKDAQSQKFIAGTVDLVAGYADKTGICTMESALQGQPISKALSDCHAKHDLKFHNKWGIAGNGSDYLGQ